MEGVVKGDEYWPGSGTEYWPNMTQETDPTKVKWARFIGKNGVGIYEYDNGGDGWYRPHENCKMRFLGKQYEFCEVCKEGLRKAFCKSTAQSKYFIVRKGDKEATGDTLGEKLKLTYKDAEGNEVTGVPAKAGTYKVEAAFEGNETYDACSIAAEYTIEPPDLITLGVVRSSMENPVVPDVKVKYDKEHEVKYHYTGTIPRVQSSYGRTERCSENTVLERCLLSLVWDRLCTDSLSCIR